MLRLFDCMTFLKNLRLTKMQDIIEYTLRVSTEFDRLYRRPILLGGEDDYRCQFICEVIADSMNLDYDEETAARSLWENGVVE